jgi:lytic murein transglycosylase
VSRRTFDAATAGLAPDADLVARGARQSEFERTSQAYLDGALSAGRVAGGAAAKARWTSELARVERAEGVPAEIIVAVWGVESEYGRGDMGGHDVLRSLATLAWSRGGKDFANEAAAALVMLEKGFATREKLKGSWAGAMGQPQFLPSAYLKYAASFNKTGAPDIWASAPDTIASIGRFFRAQGWKPGQAWGAETVVPAGFDWSSLTGNFAAFSAKGFRRADGGPLPAQGDATLYLPAGAGGPAFLLGDNYWTIKLYNNSDSYAMSVALLGERVAGRPAIRAAWPRDFKLLAPSDRARLQTLLRERGFYQGEIDGRFGPSSRDAIHRYQRAAQLAPADGFASSRVLEALSAGR